MSYLIGGLARTEAHYPFGFPQVSDGGGAGSAKRQRTSTSSGAAPEPVADESTATQKIAQLEADITSLREQLRQASESVVRISACSCVSAAPLRLQSSVACTLCSFHGRAHLLPSDMVQSDLGEDVGDSNEDDEEGDSSIEIVEPMNINGIQTAVLDFGTLNRFLDPFEAVSNLLDRVKIGTRATEVAVLIGGVCLPGEGPMSDQANVGSFTVSIGNMLHKLNSLGSLTSLQLPGYCLTTTDAKPNPSDSLPLFAHLRSLEITGSLRYIRGLLGNALSWCTKRTLKTLTLHDVSVLGLNFDKVDKGAIEHLMGQLRRLQPKVVLVLSDQEMLLRLDMRWCTTIMTQRIHPLAASDAKGLAALLPADPSETPREMAGDAPQLSSDEPQGNMFAAYCETAGSGGNHAAGGGSEQMDVGTTRFDHLRDLFNIPGAKPIKVCILDTGVDVLHPGLKRHIKGVKSFVPGELASVDKRRHGTHCAGLLAHVAPKAELYIGKVLPCKGKGSSKALAEGICWATKTISCDVISISSGGDHSSFLEEEVHAAIADNKIIVAAACNDGQMHSHSIGYPARYGHVICVGSHDRKGHPSHFSSVGRELDLLAPGEKVRSTVPGGGYESLNGTSMATPLIAGVVALVLGYDRRGDENGEHEATPRRKINGTAQVR